MALVLYDEFPEHLRRNACHTYFRCFENPNVKIEKELDPYMTEIYDIFISCACMTGLSRLTEKLSYQLDVPYLMKNRDPIIKKMDSLFETYIKDAKASDSTTVKLYSGKVQDNLVKLTCAMSFSRFDSEEVMTFSRSIIFFIVKLWMDGEEDIREGGTYAPIRSLASWMSRAFLREGEAISNSGEASSELHKILVNAVGTTRMYYISEMLVHRARKCARPEYPPETISNYMLLLCSLTDSGCCRDVLKKGFVPLVMNILKNNALPKLEKVVPADDDTVPTMVNTLLNVLIFYPRKFIGPKHMHLTLDKYPIFETFELLFNSPARNFPKALEKVNFFFNFLMRQVSGLAVIESVAKAAARANPLGYHKTLASGATPTWCKVEQSLLIQNISKHLFAFFVEKRLRLCNNVSLDRFNITLFNSLIICI